MSNTNNQPNQNEGIPEALQVLLQAMSPDATATQNVSPEALQRLSDRLSELMGEDVVRDAFAHKDKAGELVNEEGLPIVEINETDPDSQNDNESSVTLTEERKLVPWSSLPPAERERRRRERDRILDLLEAEEEIEQRKAEEKERQERLEALEKRKQAARTEIERLNALKETYRKMGKALLRAVDSSSIPSSNQGDNSSATDNKSGSSKKSVSFAESPEQTSKSSVETAKADETDWGDVSQGRLQPSNRNTGLSQSERLMKMSVVERIPGAGKQRAMEIKNEEGDSDDESDLGVSISDEGEVHDDSATEYSDNNTQNDNDLAEETDFDFAQHQREVVLEYHQKRGKIGVEAAVALTSHTHDADEELSANVSDTKLRPPISQFRASRLVSSYAAPAPSSSSSQSLEASVLPKSGAQTLQNAIRMGKLDDYERLVGGDAGESGSEGENENMQEILELLKKGEVYDLGPKGEFIHTVSPANDSRTSASAAAATPFTVPSEPLPQKPKTSKFKLTRSQASRAVNADSSVSSTSESSTPVSTAGRSSPKLPTRSVVVERVPTGTTPLTPDTAKPIAEHKASSPSVAAMSSLLRSPDRPVQTTDGGQAQTITKFSSSQRPASTPSPMAPTIIESPSFPSSSRPSYRPERPPVIMSSKVVESGRHDSQAVAHSLEAANDNSSAPAKKVPRFKAERM